MAASVVITGSTYTYTISNIQNAITVTPSNRNSRYNAVYGKPTIKRQKSGSANSRYFLLVAELTYQGSTFHTQLVKYKATFTKNGTTATVTEINTSGLLGDFAWIVAGGGTIGRMIVYAYEDQSSASWQNKAFPMSASFSGWDPSAPTIYYTASQSSPDASDFGLIAGYAEARWNAYGSSHWSYNGVGISINPNNTIKLSANGDSSTSTGSSASTSLPNKVVNAVSITGTATLTNNLGGSSTATATLTVQPYSKPVVNGLALGRVTVSGSANHASMSVGWVVDALNKDSSVQTGITSGAITATWTAEDLSDPGTVFASGTFDIISNGEAMTAVTGTKTATLVDTSGNNHNVYDPDKSYKFSVHITDRIGESSATISAILNSNFYIICVREGGRGIGFGIVPPGDEFYVNMPANFKELTESGGVYSGGINDEALLTQDTIDAVEDWLS